MHSKSEWAGQAASLLPPGPFWAGFRAEAGRGQALLRAKGIGFSALEEASERLLIDAFPGTTAQMPSDWEKVLGLPDLCAPGDLTMVERVEAVVEKLTRIGGMTAEFFERAAARLGYQITIRQYMPARCGVARCGVSELVPFEAANHWRVEVSGPRQSLARCGITRCGESLGVFRIAEDLECLLQRIRPAGTYLHFDYGEN
ncbi:phage tail protein [Alphaproteobacteria bacterium]|nr:phage tail protein [Alphaproteobacteria bacterium]